MGAAQREAWAHGRATLPPPPKKQTNELDLIPFPSPSLSFSPQAATLLAQGRAKYAAGDRMGGLRLFEAALDAAPTPPEAAAAFFNATAVHGGFGDVELAQITCRGFVGTGVADWEDAVAAATASPGGGPLQLVPPKWSPQVAIQLRKFAAGVKKAAAAGEGGGAGGRGGKPSSAPRPATAASSRPPGDLSDRLQTDLVGLDGSAAGVAKRVAGLLAALLGLGVGLYLVGKGFLEGPPPGFGG